MQTATTHGTRSSHWTHGMALERQLGLSRGMLLSNAPDGASVLGRILGATHLDGATLKQFARILAVTVRDWTQK